MILNTLRVAAATALALTLAASALAQTPTEAQREALRSNCAGDFRTNCSDVSPGGMDALLCLERNEASLSAGCKSAVDAVKGPVAPAAAPAAASSAPKASAAPKTAGTPTAKPAAPATAAAAPPALSFREELRIAARSCFGDFSRFCPSLPMGHGNMVRCLKTHESELEPVCQQAMERAGAF